MVSPSVPLNLLTRLLCACLLAEFGGRLCLASRRSSHVASHRDQVPPEFAPRIGLASHQRAADYTVARVRLGMLERVYDAVLLVALTLLGGLQAIDLLVAQATSHDLLRQLQIGRASCRERVCQYV